MARVSGIERVLRVLNTFLSRWPPSTDVIYVEVKSFTLGRIAGLASGISFNGSGRREFPNAWVLLSSPITEVRFISTAVFERSFMISAAS